MNAPRPTILGRSIAAAHVRRVTESLALLGGVGWHKARSGELLGDTAPYAPAEPAASTRRLDTIEAIVDRLRWKIDASSPSARLPLLAKPDGKLLHPPLGPCARRCCLPAPMEPWCAAGVQRTDPATPNGTKRSCGDTTTLRGRRKVEWKAVLGESAVAAQGPFTASCHVGSTAGPNPVPFGGCVSGRVLPLLARAEASAWLQPCTATCRQDRAGGIAGGRRPAGRCCVACANSAQRRRRQIRESFGSRSQHYKACCYALELGLHGAWRLEEKSL